MSTDKQIPFELTSEALAQWLAALENLSPSQAANQLYQTLKTLKDQKYAATTLLPLWLNMTPITLRLANTLSDFALFECKIPEKSRKAGRLSMHLLRQLGLGFCQFAEHKKTDPAACETAIYHALQCMGLYHLKSCLFYEMPSGTLWRKSAELFTLAVQKDCLTTPQPGTLREFANQPCIEAVVKRNALFSLLIPTLYSPQEINQLFDLANAQAEHVTISMKPDSQTFNFYWDLNDELPPCSTHKFTQSLPSGFLAIDCYDLGMTLLTPHAQVNAASRLQHKAALHLSGYRSILESIIPGQAKNYDFYIGWSAVCNYLAGLNKLSKISQLSGLPKENIEAKRRMSLIPLENERNAFETLRLTQKDTGPTGKSATVLKNPNPHYLIVEGRAFDCLTGDLVLNHDAQATLTSVELAIIRQQTKAENLNATHIVMERLPGVCSIQTLTLENRRLQAILLNENSPLTQVFLPKDRYTVDSQWAMDSGKTLRLTACMESHRFFVRFKCQIE